MLPENEIIYYKNINNGECVYPMNEEWEEKEEEVEGEEEEASLKFRR